MWTYFGIDITMYRYAGIFRLWVLNKIARHKRICISIHAHFVLSLIRVSTVQDYSVAQA